MQYFLAVVAAFNTVAIFTIGGVVYFKNRQNTTNQTLAIFSLFLGLWALGFFIVKITELYPSFIDTLDLGSLVSSSFSRSLLYLGAFFVPVAYLHFIYAVIGFENSNRKFMLIGGYLFNLLILLLLIGSSLWGTHLTGFAFGQWLNSDAIYQLWLAIWFLYVLYPIYFLIHAHKKSTTIKKYQILSVLVEYLFAITLSLTGLILFYDYQNPLSWNILNSIHIFGALHVLVVFYLFVEYKFLNMKLIISSFAKKTITVAIVATIGYAVYVIAEHILGPSSSFYFIVFFVVVIIFIYNKILAILDSQMFSFLFKTTSIKRFQETVIQFKNQNIVYESVAALQADLQKNFCEKLDIESARVVILDPEKRPSEYPELTKWFQEHSDFLVASEEKYLWQNKNIHCPYLAELKSLGEVCYPLYQSTDQLIGFFILKQRISGDIYIEEKLEIVQQAQHYITLSLIGILYTEKLIRQADELKESYLKLKKLDEAKDSFISVASHELRTPLTVMKGYADMLLSTQFGKMNKQQNDFTQRILGGTERLLQIVTNILDISNLEAERMEFKFSEINTKEILDKVITNFKNKCAEETINLKLMIKPPSSDFILKTDPAKLECVLSHLVRNAIKYTPANGQINIKIEKYEDDVGFLKFEVQNTGKGIPKDSQKKLFEKFSQVENFLEKTYAGTGLGLAIVKKIILRLGGRVWVDSEPERGTKFIFLIPLS